MKLSILLSTILLNFATSVPNLCDDAFLDASGDPVTDLVGQTLSRFCEWTGPDAPVWDAKVCCSFDDAAASCSKTNARGSCSSGTTPMYCEYGAVEPDGGVTCYQPFPSACDAGLCIEAPEIIPVAQMSKFIMCCGGGGACQYVPFGQSQDCQGQLLACGHGIINQDGTVDCLEQ